MKSPVYHLTIWRMSLPEGERSLRAAAELLGVKTVQLYRYEHGLNRIPAEYVSRIARITGIRPSDLRPDVFSEIDKLKVG